jgi:hypothetical protein
MRVFGGGQVLTFRLVRHLLTRLAVGFVFASFGLWEVFDPQFWIGFVPSWVPVAFVGHSLVVFHGVVLLVVGVALLVGAWLRWSALLAVLLLVEICVGLFLSSGFSDLFVRDLGLLLFTLSIVFDGERYFCVTA